MKRGFTLIEMILVIAIITILSGIVFVSSLRSFRSSAVEGVSNETISIIKQLYDYQNTQGKFIDQVLNESKNFNEKDLIATYNVVFQFKNEEVNVELRNKENVIEKSSVSSISFTGDLEIVFNEGNENILKKINKEELKDRKYILTFDSKGRVIRSIDNEVLINDYLNIIVENKSANLSNSITISSPPRGNIIMERGNENDKE